MTYEEVKRIRLNPTAEDVKAIRELQKMGVTDEQIQEWYDNSKRSDSK